MQTSVDEIVKWSTDNYMNINTSKTKGMIIDFTRSSQSIVTDITTADDCSIEFPPSSCSGSHYQMTFVGAAM